MAKIACPRCGQDWLEGVEVVFSKEFAIHCPECDAFWTQGLAVRRDTFVDLGTFLRAKGRVADDPGELIRLGEVDASDSATLVVGPDVPLVTHER